MDSRLQRKVLVLLVISLTSMAVSLYYTLSFHTISSRDPHLDLQKDVKVADGTGSENSTAGTEKAGTETAKPGAAEAEARNYSTSGNSSIPGELKCLKLTLPDLKKLAIPPSAPRFMDIAGGGRLGNTMFEYAALVATAARLGARAVLPTGQISQTFKLTAVANFKPENRAVFGESRFMAYDPCIERVPAGYNLTLSGYFQSWRYFQNYTDLIRSEFKFKDLVHAQATQFLRQHGDKVKVGVHVRRGDMLLNKHKKVGYVVADEGYIKRAMDYFRKQLKDPLFVMLTDTPSWCTSRFKADDVVFVGKSPAMDLAVMAHCNHSIITTGTFGWWGAWLAGGQTVYYENFPRNGSWMKDQFVAADFFPPKWIPMS